MEKDKLIELLDNDRVDKVSIRRVKMSAATKKSFAATVNTLKKDLKNDCEIIIQERSDNKLYVSVETESFYYMVIMNFYRCGGVAAVM